MKRGTKIGLGVVIAVVGAIVVAAVLVVSRLDRAIIDAVERTGREATGTEVSLDAADVSLGERRAVLRGLTVANVEGYEAPNALTIATISLDVNLDSLTGDVAKLDDVVVEGGDLYAEERGGALNLATLLERIQEPDEPASEAAPEARIMIDRFRMTGARVHLDSEQLDGEAVLELPDVVVEDVGTETGGVTYGEATEALLGPVLAAARSAVRERAGEALSEAAEREIEEAAREEVDRLLDE